jgi:hypothetical protein
LRGSRLLEHEQRPRVVADVSILSRPLLIAPLAFAGVDQVRAVPVVVVIERLSAARVGNDDHRVVPRETAHPARAVEPAGLEAEQFR